jgi:hypothetical protein
VLENCLNYDEFLVDIRDADFWSDLDSIVTHPTGSRLQSSLPMSDSDSCKESTSISVTTCLLSMMIILWTSRTRPRSWNLSLVHCLYFVRGAFCFSAEHIPPQPLEGV